MKPESLYENPAAVQSTAANRNLSLFPLSQCKGPYQAGVDGLLRGCSAVTGLGSQNRDANILTGFDVVRIV
jgi:hypothetical protein